MTANQINFYKAQTERMHYDRADAETLRHNYATEGISTDANVIQSWFNAQQAAHLERQDAINKAHYERQDAEATRHNSQQEKIGYYQVQLDYQKLPIEQQKADASTTQAEAAERNATTNAFLSLGEDSVNYARAANLGAETLYIPKYYKISEIKNTYEAMRNIATSGEALSRIPGNLAKGIPIIGLLTGG